MYFKYLILFLATVAYVHLPAQSSTFQELYDIMQVKCAGCHSGGSPQGNLDLSGTMVDVYTNIVEADPTNPSARSKGYKQIKPGYADDSYLLRKIATEEWDDSYPLDVADGRSMPNNNLPSLSEVEIELFRQWIIHGAPLDKKVVERSLLEDYYENGKALPASPRIAAPEEGEGFQIRMGPFFLPPLAETEVFWKQEIELPEEGAEISNLDLEFNTESHHFILYKTDSQSAASTREGLRPLEEAEFAMINNELVSAWQDATIYNLPENTAYRFEADDVLDLNYHIKNYSVEGVLAAEVYLNVYTQPVGTAAKEMYSILIPVDLFGLFQGRGLGAPLVIPNDGQEYTFTDHIWVPPFGGVGVPTGEWHIWQISTHTHARGVDYDVYLAADANGTKGEQIYEGYFNFDYVFNQGFYDWEHPAIRVFDPLLPVDMSFGGGLVQEATYVNDTERTLRWGNTTDDEMMLMFVHFTDGPIPVVGVEETDLANTNAFRSAPNPYQGETTISYQLSDRQEVRLEVYNLLGKRVQTLCNETQAVGTYNYQFSAKQQSLPTGMYLVELNIGGKRATQKIIEME